MLHRQLSAFFFLPPSSFPPPPPPASPSPNRLLLGRCLSVGRAAQWRGISQWIITEAWASSLSSYHTMALLNCFSSSSSFFFFFIPPHLPSLLYAHFSESCWEPCEVARKKPINLCCLLLLLPPPPPPLPPLFVTLIKIIDIIGICSFFRSGLKKCLGASIFFFWACLPGEVEPSRCSFLQTDVGGSRISL